MSAVGRVNREGESFLCRTFDTLRSIDLKTVCGIALTIFAGISEGAIIFYNCRGSMNVTPVRYGNASFCSITGCMIK
ncbi:MAG: hypothetical protein JW924_04685 [Fusobacteriaceae bacterium]|nr:hypothetical protein [Fusobacteriaceae bacterium]